MAELHLNSASGSAAAKPLTSPAQLAQRQFTTLNLKDFNLKRDPFSPKQVGMRWTHISHWHRHGFLTQKPQLNPKKPKPCQIKKGFQKSHPALIAVNTYRSGPCYTSHEPFPSQGNSDAALESRNTVLCVLQSLTVCLQNPNFIELRAISAGIFLFQSQSQSPLLCTEATFLPKRKTFEQPSRSRGTQALQCFCL